MISGYKIIGVCITKINDESCTEFVEYLSQEAISNGYRVFVFNSFRDLYYGDSYDMGAKSIYKAINFDVLDALVLDYRSFFDKELFEGLIKTGKEHNLPIVVLNQERDDCFCIVNDFCETYKELIRHVIGEHHVRKINFLAGIKGEKNSEARLNCYKEVLAEFGIPFEEERVAYGDYWKVPVYNAIDSWMSSGKPLPDAIICANDSSAIDTCDRLEYYGYSVPDDILVTGFDGIQSANFHEPQLSTCRKDNRSYARSCMKLIKRSINEGCEPYSVPKKYNVIISESCGCKPVLVKDFREQAKQLYKSVIEMQQHETALYSWADHVVENTDLNSIGEQLHDNILPGSSVFLNSNFLSALRKGEKTNPDMPFTAKMISIATKDETYKSHNQEVFKLSDLFPKVEKHISEKVAFIFQSIYVEDRVCGYYFMKSVHVGDDAHKIHRLCRIMNIAFGTLVSRIEQSSMASRIEDMPFRDPHTDLLNLKGLVNRMEEIRESAQTKRMAVSIYSIARYKFITENYGIADIEEAVSLVSEALQLANPSNSVIARIADDEFAVINLENPDVNMGDIIINAVAIFFSNTESYNDSSGKDYYIEVNCGCTVADPGWTGDINSFLKVANSEMYLNRLKNENSKVLKEKKTPKEAYRMFQLLVEKNLFIYNFQPIVNARTGEIYAYEALMRTTGEINMNPGEILQIATDYNRLYDIECATVYNIMSFASQNREKFEGKKIFINTIPGHFLNQDDYDYISSTYGDILKNCVIEITEQGEITDEELNRIKDFGGKDSGCQLAIDDYGAGTSNIVNLLRYNPHVIKIDRFLISEIQNDVNKQMFVKNVIEFAQMNGIKTIAEGVETKEELDAVISYGVDLIQGFYTARPNPDPIQELPEDKKKDILEANKKSI